MLRPIVRFGDRALAEPARPVDALTPDVQTLIDDLVQTMHAAPGVGIAAPQVGVPLQIFAIDLSVGTKPDDLIVLVNPRVVSREGLQLQEEGCLSVPGFSATVCRPSRMVVEGLDREGRRRRIAGTGLLARALQHEIDHLRGRLFLDRLRQLRRAAIEGRIARLRRQGRW